MTHKRATTLIVSSIPTFLETVIKCPNFKYARGEPKEFKTPFLPKAWREDMTNFDKSIVNKNSTFTNGELSILQKCQTEFLNGKLEDPYFDRIIKNPEKNINLENEDLLHWAALAQHYGKPTRLVDLTTDLLVALYFAVEQCPEENGFVYYFKDNFNEIHKSRRVERGGTFFDIKTVATELYDKYPATPDDNTTSIIKPSYPNTRIEAQRGAFCFTKGIGIAAYAGGYLIVEIPREAKKEITTALDRIGYNKDTLFPGNYTHGE
jgi:hypothetical protein